jgi:hypothetical protein
MCAQLYVWHMLDDRHFFLRRAVLGWGMSRGKHSEKGQQREADMDEVFDERLHTTGFSRPLKNACDGGDTCDQTSWIIGNHPNLESSKLLGQLWKCLVTDVLEYVRTEEPDQEKEEKLNLGLQETMAKCWRGGLVYEMNWLVCHASHHAWQVNYLMEAAMFGSLLDAGTLAGKLDRAD